MRSRDVVRAAIAWILLCRRTCKDALALEQEKLAGLRDQQKRLVRMRNGEPWRAQRTRHAPTPYRHRTAAASTP